MAEESRPRIPLSELEKTPEYLRLTGKQKLWISTYVAAGEKDGNYDPVLATRTAYQCKSLETARVMSYSITQNIRIIEVLNMHFNKTPIEEFLQSLDRAVHNKNVTIAQVNALKLKADVLGIGSRIPNKQAFDQIPADVQADTKARKRTKKQKEKAARDAVHPTPSKKFSLF